MRWLERVKGWRRDQRRRKSFERAQAWSQGMTLQETFERIYTESKWGKDPSSLALFSGRGSSLATSRRVSRRDCTSGCSQNRA